MNNDLELKKSRLFVIILISAAIAAIVGDGLLCGIVVFFIVLALGEMLRLIEYGESND